jgi:hypothetical protein
MVERNQIADLKRVLATIRLQIQVLEASVPKHSYDRDRLRRIKMAKSQEQTLLAKIAGIQTNAH